MFMERGKGAVLWDADGNSYVDFCLSWGPLILGHAHPRVLQKAVEALRKGSSFGTCHEREVLLAEEIARSIPSMQQVRLVSSGTEAAMGALRLARGYTRRSKILKFIGGYHGSVDSLLVQAGSGAMTLGRSDSAGVPEQWAQGTLSAPYNDAEAVHRIFKERGDQIAAVIVEPVAANMGVVVPQKGFLETLRQITQEYGALLIFDEVVTGFRFCAGGVQSLFGIQPDLTCLGKIVGGGFPLAAFGGRREIMGHLAPEGPVYQAGTLSGNPVAAAAGLETLRLLKTQKSYGRLSSLTESLCRELGRIAESCEVPVRINRTASMWTLFFAEDPVTDYSSAQRSDVQRYAAFFRKMLEEGIYLPPSQFEACFLSVRHGTREIEKTLEAARFAFSSLRRAPTRRREEIKPVGV